MSATPMYVTAAKVLCQRCTELCDVDFEDSWKQYGDHYLLDAQAMLDAIAAAPDLLEALREITSDYADRFDLDDPSTNPGIKSSIEQARAAIVKATGEQP